MYGNLVQTGCFLYSSPKSGLNAALVNRRPKGLTENDGHENDGPSKLQGMKLQDMKMPDMKMTDKNDGRARSCRRTNRVLTVCKFLNPKHRNTLCIRFHTGVCLCA